ncbi:NACHT, LRR and PYD domains-containing protein 3-like [Erpetoichthys calabaricus]|nr:NACHT, LRR and PYD domains-containing protein 3-like [Erpetoichthys calabaricus]
MAQDICRTKRKCGAASSYRRRSDEEVAGLSGLTQVFSEVIKSFSHEDLLRITEYYKPYLVYVIEYDITSILQNLVTKDILTNDQAKRFKLKEESKGQAGVESFISNVMKMDRVVLVSLWKALAEEIVRFPSPNLTKILEEVTKGGPFLLQEIQASLQPLSIKTHIKGLHETHRGAVSESTETLENQTSPGDPCTRSVVFETRYTELMVINQYKRTYNETQHELLKTGQTHAELVEKRTKEKCERIWTEQLFRRSPGSETSPHVVVVSGVAGIGKTTMVQKIMFDWARGIQYHRFAFVFLFKFRDLNLLDTENEPQMPLTRLIVRHYKYLNDPRLINILQKPESLLFILDGLDEYKHKLDFNQTRLCTKLDDYVPVHTLLISLVCGNLLKGCSILITTRPTALESLDMERVDRYAEILGFFPEQRLMYFKKFFGDSDLGTEAFQYVEENAILYTMCFNPSYCWIICSVLKSHFMTPEEKRGAAPKTVTELFVLFLHNILTNHKREADHHHEILVKLGKMAYYGVANKVLVFYDKFEMFTFGLRPVLSTPFLSGFLKEILQRESTLEYTTYTFFHLTLQEFMAACYFYLDPSAGNKEMLVKLDSCEDGRFEIFIRFLAGLARYSVFKTLDRILGKFKMKTAKSILEWVKQKAERALQGQDKNEALRVCQWLYETRNNKLIRDAIGTDLKMDFSESTLSPLDCAVLGSVISCCGELQELILSQSRLTAEGIRRLVPGLIFCEQVSFYSCSLTSKCCEVLSSALSAEQSHLTNLDLGYNNLKDAGICLLCEGLWSPNCKLETLGLQSCGLTSGCCDALSLAFCADSSHLTQLDLGENKLEDSGVYLLCEGLRKPNSTLKELRLYSCGLTSGCCEALASVLSVHDSHLAYLELRKNNLEDLGVIKLCEGTRSPNSKLDSVWLMSTGLTSKCCEALSLALSVEHSQLVELLLEDNNLSDSGVHLLCEGLKSPNCKVELLRLSSCGLTFGCCEALSSAISVEHSQLTELELNDNQLEDSGVHHLCDGLRNKNCKLETLGLESCGLTAQCCEALSSALSSEHSHLTELLLDNNNLENSGVHLLCKGLRNKICKLETLRISNTGISEDEKRNLKALEKELNRAGRHVEINI